MRMRRLIAGSALAFATLASCVDTGQEGTGTAELNPDGYSGPVFTLDSIPVGGTVPEGCVRLEGASLGKNVTLTIGGKRTITLTGWTAATTKSGRTDQYVRFSFVASGPVAYVVRAGADIFPDTALLWSHPAGLSGKNVKPIMDITFCAAPPGTGGSAPAAPAPSSPTPSPSPSPTDGGYGGAACIANLECWSGECRSNVCSKGWSFDRCVDGARDCVSTQCTALGCAPVPNGERGATCLDSLQCWSGACVSGFCQGGDLGDACRSTDDCKIGYGCGSSGTCQVGFSN
jgi:hypothetical protein